MLQANANYILRKIAGENVLISTGESVANFNGYIQLNDSACLLWKQLSKPQSKEDLIQLLLENYEVTLEQASCDVEEFIELLRKHGMIYES